MDDPSTFYWGILAGVAVTTISATILGVWNRFSAKRQDAVVLTADISQPGDMAVMEFIGCASMVVTLTCKSVRPAKISSALIALEGIDLIPEFEKAFGASFGYVPVKAGPPPALTIDLVPLSEPDSPEGFVLQRDDVVRFAMPIRVPVLHLFPKAPSQNVWIAVKFFDGTEEVLLRGLRIQHMIDDLITMWGNQKQTLNVNLEIGLRACSAVLPGNPELVGKTNPNPLIYLPNDSPSEVKERVGADLGTVTVRFPLYSIVSPDGTRTAMFQTEDGLLLPILTTLEIAEQHRAKCPVEVKIHEIPSLTALREFVQNPPTQAGSAAPNFKVFFDSIDPQQRKGAVISREGFLATM